MRNNCMERLDMADREIRHLWATVLVFVITTMIGLTVRVVVTTKR